MEYKVKKSTNIKENFKIIIGKTAKVINDYKKELNTSDNNNNNNSSPLDKLISSNHYSDTKSVHNYYPDDVIGITTTITTTKQQRNNLKQRLIYEELYKNNVEITRGKYLKGFFKYPIYFYNQQDFDEEILENPLDGGSHKFKSSGCGVVSMSIVVSTFLGKNITPIDLAKIAFKTGSYTGDNNGTYINKIPDTIAEYGLNAELVKNDSNGRLKVLNALKSGNALVIVNVRRNDNVEPQFTLGGHYMVLTDLNDDNEVYVVDPNNGLERGTGKYWSFEKNIVPQLQTIEDGCFVIITE